MNKYISTQLCNVLKLTCNIQYTLHVFTNNSKYLHTLNFYLHKLHKIIHRTVVKRKSFLSNGFVRVYVLALLRSFYTTVLKTFCYCTFKFY